jgi:hypothetical protein
LDDSLKAFGFKLEEEIKSHCEVWELNHLALQVFCACTDDWKFDRAGQYKSIDKLALGAVMEMMGVSDRKSMFTDILIMQNAALEVLSNG